MTYQWCAHGHHFPLVPRLNDGRVDALDSVGQAVKIAGNKLVCREKFVENVEKLHQPRRNKFRDCQVWREGESCAGVPEPAWLLQWMSVWFSHCGVSYAKEACDHGIDIAGVEFVEIAVVVDQDVALERGFSEGVVTEAVMSKVVEDLKSKEEAGRGNIGVPVKDGAVDDLDLVQMATGGGRTLQMVDLQGGKGGRNFDNTELGALVDLGIRVADVVQNVDHQGPVSGAHLVYKQIVVGILRQLVIGDEISRNGLAIVWTEQLGRSMPQLAGFVVLLLVQFIFELRVPLAQDAVELGLVFEIAEDEGLARMENDDLFRKVAVVGIVQAVCKAN